MESESWHKMSLSRLCVILMAAALASGAPNWPSEEFYGQHYDNVYPAKTEVASGSESHPAVENANSEPSITTSTLPPPKKSVSKPHKRRWLTRRRLSDREAVAVMEEELERREATNSANPDKIPRREAKIRDADGDATIASEAAPGTDIGIVAGIATGTDSVPAAANRRSGNHSGVIGPVHTFVKTDKHGHYKWGVRHHAGHM